MLGKLNRKGGENWIHDTCLVFCVCVSFILGKFGKFILTMLKLLWNENCERGRKDGYTKNVLVSGFGNGNYAIMVASLNE